MFNFEYEKVGKNGDILAVVLFGTIDETNYEYLLKCVAEEILDGSKKLILNCEQLTYISSMGLGMLVRVHSRMRKLGGDVKLAAVHNTVAQILSVVGLNKLFHIYPTVEAAIASHDA
ncbi:MAG: STAS domain-containing protein [Planctomycetia bacterium]|nr:STAS domain-containing protein [Planctomycetia bacterium]